MDVSVKLVSVCLSVCLSVSVSLSLCLCLSVSLSLCLCLSLYLSLFPPPPPPPVCLSVSVLIFYLFTYLSPFTIIRRNRYCAHVVKFCACVSFRFVSDFLFFFFSFSFVSLNGPRHAQTITNDESGNIECGISTCTDGKKARNGSQPVIRISNALS